MGRPSLGPAKKSETIAIHVTRAQYDLIRQQGIPGVWCRQVVLAALLPAATRATKTEPAEPAPPKRELKRPVQRTERHQDPTEPETRPHRHVRERVGDHWVGGTNVGKFKCKTCRVEMGVLQ
jgi:hypothetical protein